MNYLVTDSKVLRIISDLNQVFRKQKVQYSFDGLVSINLYMLHGICYYVNASVEEIKLVETKLIRPIDVFEVTNLIEPEANIFSVLNEMFYNFDYKYSMDGKHLRYGSNEEGIFLGTIEDIPFMYKNVRPVGEYLEMVTSSKTLELALYEREKIQFQNRSLEYITACGVDGFREGYGWGGKKKRPFYQNEYLCLALNNAIRYQLMRNNKNPYEFDINETWIKAYFQDKPKVAYSKHPFYKWKKLLQDAKEFYEPVYNELERIKKEIKRLREDKALKEALNSPDYPRDQV